MNINVLQEFTEKINLANMQIDNALRHYLSYFTLPGESQQVDRIMQKFADKYFRDQKETIYKTSDTIYTFSYLLIMLQTDLHNPRVEEKMKFTDFCKLAKGINDGEDLPAEML